ncbi:MAG: hypothetical protein HYS43_00135 [Candidatus Liptonbacteria bacterium]|nr:hypothetical protein [Candidatus Liptonbacteria bacterium]
MEPVRQTFHLFARELAALFSNHEVEKMSTSLLALYERLPPSNTIVNLPPELINRDRRLDPYIQVLEYKFSVRVVPAFDYARLVLVRPSQHSDPNRTGVETGAHRSGVPSLLHCVEFAEEFRGKRLWEIADEVDRRSTGNVMTIAEVLMLGIQHPDMVAGKEVAALRSRYGGSGFRTCTIPSTVRGSFMAAYFGEREVGIRPIDANEVHGSGDVFAATYRANLVPGWPDTVPEELRAA